jgi:hypothetical protein
MSGFVEDALKEILGADADVSALAGNRIYSGVLNDASLYPAIAYRQIDGTADPTLDSPGDGPFKGRFIFFSVAKGVLNGTSPKRQAALLHKYLKTALIGYQNTVLLPDTETLYIQGIFFDTEADTYDDRTQTYQYAAILEVNATTD